MSHLLTLVSPLGLVDLALKSAIVMLVAVVAAALLRRASAAWRHLVWCLSATSLLLLPVLALALPAWQVTWLPEWPAERAPLAATGLATVANADRITPLAGPPLETPPPIEIDVPPSAAAAPTDATTEPSPALSVAATATTSPRRAPFPWLAGIWGAGLLLSLVPLAFGLWQVSALHRRSRVIDDPRWLALLGDLRRQLALRRSVQLRESNTALMPLTWGALRPVLLVPAEAGAWPDDRRRLVLLHELAHVRRWDWLTQLVTHIACAAYWFNPLVWLAARQMRIERERACDDLVLASGARASDYAQELLAVAASLSSSQLSTLVAVPIARRGALEDRLRGILDNHRSRAALTTTAVFLGAALAAAATSPLAMLRAAPPDTPQPPAEQSKAAQAPGNQPAKKPVDKSDARVAPEFVITPDSVSFGNLNPGETKSVNVVIRARKQFSIEKIEAIEKIEGEKSSGTYEFLLSKGAKQSHVVALTLTAPNKPGFVDELFSVTIAGRTEPVTFKAQGKVVGGAPPVNEKPAAKKSGDQPGEAGAAPQKDPLVGKVPAERVKQFPPSFSKAQDGVEIGISLASDRKAFHLGERVPLEFVIRNVSQKTLHVEHSLYPAETPPKVIGADGKQLSIEAVTLFGTIRRYRDILKPNEFVVYRHRGLGLGESPQPPGTFWHPFLKNADAVPGKYRLSQHVRVSVHEEGHDTGGTTLSTATGEVEFEIEEKPAEPPASKPVTIRGKVLDDATGEPIPQFTVQAGKFEPAEPKQVLWGYREEKSTGSDGSFSTTVNWPEGWNARIRLDGYFPHPLLDSAPPADRDELEVTIRLQRVPEKVRGVVLDHAGKPVTDAAVFAVGPAGLNLAVGEAWSAGYNDRVDKETHRVRTDELGRFEIPTGGNTTLGVSHARFDAWPAAVPARGEVIIRLPEPARVDIELDIDGAGKETVIFYQLLSYLTPEFGGVQSTRWITMANPGQLVLDSLPPGKYQFCRRPGRMLDRQFIELKPGESKSIHYVREKGARVRGKVTWAADAKLESIVISVLGETPEKGPFDQRDWTTVYSAVSPGDDGTFLTERIPLGTYQLIAYAFKPLTPEQMRRTGAIAPSYEAQVQIKVPDHGELTVDDLPLKPIVRRN
ncbi:MAG: hypothetical protein HY290_14625 [Planctomycetia bacterium]|nr:hypothetical protein [Planctomycetia bacterium]